SPLAPTPSRSLYWRARMTSSSSLNDDNACEMSSEWSTIHGVSAAASHRKCAGCGRAPRLGHKCSSMCDDPTRATRCARVRGLLRGPSPRKEDAIMDVENFPDRVKVTHWRS